MELSRTQKKEWAKELFTRQQLTQKEIAAKIGISENSLTAWIKKGLWDEERKTLLSSKQEQLKMLYKQLDLLNKEGLKALEDDDPNTKPDTDRIVKTTKSIKQLELQIGIGDMIDTGMDFIKFVFPEDPAFAKEATRWFDLFIESKLKTF